jgi:dUTP diphosphatase
VSELPIRRLREGAVIPSRAYVGDAGVDLSACEAAELEPGGRSTVGTGLAIAVPDGFAGLVLPRSGLAAKHGIGVLNAPGLIDSGYRGEVRVILYNPGRETFRVEPGMRIAQLVLVAVEDVRLVEVDVLPESERGERGFGSSKV